MPHNYEVYPDGPEKARQPYRSLQDVAVQVFSDAVGCEQNLVDELARNKDNKVGCVLSNGKTYWYAELSRSLEASSYPGWLLVRRLLPSPDGGSIMALQDIEVDFHGQSARCNHFAHSSTQHEERSLDDNDLMSIEKLLTSSLMLPQDTAQRLLRRDLREFNREFRNDTKLSRDRAEYIVNPVGDSKKTFAQRVLQLLGLQKVA